MENQNLFKEKSAGAYDSASVASVAGLEIPADTVVIESLKKDKEGKDIPDENGILVGIDGIYYLRNLQAETRYILKTDAYIDSNTGVPSNVEFVLDGGNLHRDKNVRYVPKKITCINGSFIDDETTESGGMSYTHIVGARENTSVVNFHHQTNYVVEFNMMDFVHSEDYREVGYDMSINLNNVIDRIFSSLYNTQLYCPQKMVIKMPETYFGIKTFFVDRPVKLLHNVTLDLSGAMVYVSENFEYTQSGNGFGSRHVFSFDTNPEHKVLATSIVKNVEIMLYKKDEDSKSQSPDVIFDLTHFSGVMENVRINLNGHLGCVALWQPFGTPTETYSDRKIIRRCKVVGGGWRTETPTVVFCKGDGCIIEHCELGYVAIIDGKSYTIRGCLNDSYFLYDSVVDFTGSYWGVSQFQILDSNVRFAACKLDCQNNNLGLLISDERLYIGPWMAVDTEGCRNRLKNMLMKLNLGEKNFNDIKAVSDTNEFYDKYKAHVANRFSTVTFDSTVRSQQVYWGYRQPISSPLLKVGEGARIIGMENLESVPNIYIHNTVNSDVFGSDTYGDVTVNAVNSATIPLVNGDFFDLHQDIEIPTKVEIEVKEDHPTYGDDESDKYKKIGCDWANDTFDDFEVRFLLDRQRGIYSTPTKLKLDDSLQPEKDSELIIAVKVDMKNRKYSNLMVELSFTRSVGSSRKKYLMRQHFSRPVPSDILSYGQKNILPATLGQMEVARFIISKVNPDAAKEAIENQKDVEVATVGDDISKPDKYTLSDYCGNMYEPDGQIPLVKCTATKLQHIGNNNVRAYVTVKPDMEGWNEGDEVVVPSGKKTSLYLLVNKQWCQLY